MAERAVLAREREDEQYDLWLSRWGGTDRRLAAVCAGVSPRAVSDSWERCREAVSWDSLVGTLDYLSTAVLYRENATSTTVFLPLWFGLPLADARPEPTAGALVAVASILDARAIRSAFRRLKRTLADAVLDGRLPIAVTPLVLSTAISRFEFREFHLAPPFTNG